LVYYYETSKKLNATPNAVDPVMDLLLSRPAANTSENQPINNLKPSISANTTSPVKKLKFALFFCSDLCDLRGMI